MRKIDNTEKIIKLIEPYWKPGLYYYVQIIKRRKDLGNETLRTTESIILQRSIKSLDEFKSDIIEFKKIADENNARIYMSLLPKSVEKTYHALNVEISTRISKSNYSLSPWKLLPKVIESDAVRLNKEAFGRTRIIIDVDTKDPGELLRCREFLLRVTTVHSEIPTLNGCHIWVDAFNPNELKSFGLITMKDLGRACITLVYFNNHPKTL